MTVNQAAALLGCHRNTVLNRVRAGMYEAEKVMTERGPTWMIDRNSLTTNAPTSARQQGVSGVPVVQQEALQELARQIVREAGLQAGEQQELRERREHAERVGRYSRTLEGLRTTWNMQFEIAKHISTVSGVFLLGLGALVGVFSPDPSLLTLAGVASGLLVVSLIVSIFEMTRVPNVLLYDIAEGFLTAEVAAVLPEEVPAHQAEDARIGEAVKAEIDKELEKLPGLGQEGHVSLWTVARWTALLTLGGGAGCFLVFALYNLIGGL